jgi:nitrous oxidase accessory protein NosD
VRGNRLSNGGPSGSGSGIMVGDEGGSHIVVKGNTLTNPGQVGIGVAGGQNIRILDNSVFSASHPWSNIGIYVWNQSGGTCSNVEVRETRLNGTSPTETKTRIGRKETAGRHRLGRKQLAPDLR